MKNLIPILSVLAFLIHINVINVQAQPALNCESDGSYPEISLEELKKIAGSSQATIIDVNSKESFDQTRVTGAIHYGTVKAKLSQSLPSDKSRLIVAYCGGPSCTAWKKAAKEACALGYTNIKHFKAGLKGWKSDVSSSTRM